MAKAVIANLETSQARMLKKFACGTPCWPTDAQNKFLDQPLLNDNLSAKGNSCEYVKISPN